MTEDALPAGARIFVAGHRGMVGSALVRALNKADHRNLLLRTRQELDLTEQASVRYFFEKERPEVVLLAAAKVGGILANDTYRADFIAQNLAIQDNVIQAAHRGGVQHLLFLGSSCIYPRECPQPIREEYLLTGPLEPTNRPYALAKIAGIEMCDAYNRQYGTDYRAAMPTNLYGPGDNYDLSGSHVIPALLRKFHEAKVADHRTVTVWGSGKPRREFLHVDDLAQACLRILSMPRTEWQQIAGGPFVNVGCGEDLSIAELAALVQRVVGHQGGIEFDSSKPDGTPRKCLDVSRMRATGWRPNYDLTRGLEHAYQAFLSEQGNDAR